MNLALIGFVTLFIGSLAIGTSCANARKAKVRLWSNSDLYRQCLKREWPLSPDDYQSPVVVLSLWGMTLIGCIALSIFLGTGLIAFICLVASQLMGWGGCFVLLFPVLFMGSFLFTIPVGIRLAWTSIARTPQQCWCEVSLAIFESDRDAISSNL